MSLFLFFLDAVSQVSVLHCHRAFLAFFFNLHWLQPSINSRCRCPAGPCRVVCWEGAETQQGFGSRLVSSEQRASGRTSLWTCRKAKAVNPSLVSNQLAESCRQGVVLNSSQKKCDFLHTIILKPLRLRWEANSTISVRAELVLNLLSPVKKIARRTKEKAFHQLPKWISS